MEALAQRIGHTDKHTVHSYAQVYDELFSRRLDIKSLLEIGIFKGGSIQVWSELFPNAAIYGIDTDFSKIQIPQFSANVKLIKGDAYDSKVHTKLPPFDVIIDDGPHTLHSQKQCLQLYLSKLNPGGLLVIEDVVEMSWVPRLQDCVPAHLHKHIIVKDLRHIKGRHDDILFIVDLLHN